MGEIEERGGAMIVRVAEIVVGAVFLISGGLKAWNPSLFYGSIEGYQILPAIPALLLAYYLPYLEIVLGLGLVAGVKVLECASLTVGLLVVFLAALVSVWLRGIDIECGCFGSGSAASGLWEPILRDGFLFLVMLYVIRARVDAGGCNPDQRERR